MCERVIKNGVWMCMHVYMYMSRERVIGSVRLCQ